MRHREERETWIRAKYEQRAFVAPLQPSPGATPPDDAMPVWLLSAVTERDLPRLLLLLAHSTKEQINHRPESSTLPRTALHAACQLGDVVMTQLLVWVGVASLMFHYYPIQEQQQQQGLFLSELQSSSIIVQWCCLLYTSRWTRINQLLQNNTKQEPLCSGENKATFTSK